MQNDQVRLHHFVPASRVNGPGARAVIWVQGCALGCPGCFNPETHDFQAGEWVQVGSLFERIMGLRESIEGITISGGEPVHQHRPLAQLMQRVREQSGLSILVFSGYNLPEIQRIPGIQAFLDPVDVLIAGRYDQNQRVASHLIGSGNKSLHFFTGRYSASDLEQVPQAEVLLSPDGEIILSGIDPLRWNQ